MPQRAWHSDSSPGVARDASAPASVSQERRLSEHAHAQAHGMQLRQGKQILPPLSTLCPTLLSTLNFQLSKDPPPYRFTAPPSATLTTLNDDCLLRICSLLAVREQFALLQLNTRLRQLVLHLWERKYADAFDWAELQPPNGKHGLSEAAQRKLLRTVARVTRGLLNLRPELLLNSSGSSSGRKRKRMPRIERISFTQCNGRLLLELPAICSNLQQLQLGGGGGVTHGQLAQLLQRLPQLTHFELQPGGPSGSCMGSRVAWLEQKQEEEELPTMLILPQTLQTLKLPACALRAAATEIARLPQLRHLTGFLCDCGDDKEQANDANTLTTATVSACLTALKEQAEAGAGAGAAAAAAPAYQIVTLNLHCQLDARLPRLLLGHLSGVLRLQRFTWHSRLMLNYDPKDGSIKWLPHRPAVAHAMLNFLLSQAASLNELDFTGNVHAVPFMAELMQRLHARGRKPQCTVWNDGCPRPQAKAKATGTAAKADASGGCSQSDLARIELELKRLTNGKASEGN